MDKRFRWGLVFIAILFAAYGLAPTVLNYADGNSDDRQVEIAGPLGDFLTNNGKFLTLGLDLQGGLLLQYKVLVDAAVQDKLDRTARDVRERLTDEEAGIAPTVDHPKGENYIRVEFKDANANDHIDSDFMAYYQNFEKVSQGGGVIDLQMTDEQIQTIKQDSVEQAVQTIRDRVNALGVTEPSIARRGASNIVVQLPGLGEEDQERAKELIGQTAQLVFRMVDEQGTNPFFNQFKDGYLEHGFTLREYGRSRTVTYTDKECSDDQDRVCLKEFFQDKTDEDHMVGYEHVTVTKPNSDEIDEEASYWRSYYVFTTSDKSVTGDFIQSARVSQDQQTNKPVVSLTFDRKGTEQFGDLTSEHVNERFAIMLDDEIQSAPEINEPITGGRAQITMGRLQSYGELQQEAQDLVIVLRHGALPAPIELQYQTAVGPTLGQDSIRSSTLALAVGSLLIILFMLFYYRGSGVVSVTALLLNMIFILAALAGLGATLTLPGIAGIILTVGMAVDANVIIFERIREEVHLDSSARKAVNSGFDKAFSAVIDANITTGIAALVLLQYGTGPVRGFAVTLLIGIVSTIFTAVFVSRWIFDEWLEWRPDDKQISI